MMYSIWEGESITLMPGEAMPYSPDGRRLDHTAVMVARFEADSWEEACQKMHERLKFDPYRGHNPEKIMTHQFAIGDTVRLNGTNQEAEVIGLEKGASGQLLHVELTGSQGKVYFPINSVTLVRSAGTAQPNHPRKIET